MNRPDGGPMLLNLMPIAELFLTRTGHWMQWERAEEFNELTTAFLPPNHEAIA